MNILQKFTICIKYKPKQLTIDSEPGLTAFFFIFTQQTTTTKRKYKKKQQNFVCVWLVALYCMRECARNYAHTIVTVCTRARVCFERLPRPFIVLQNDM